MKKRLLYNAKCYDAFAKVVDGCFLRKKVDLIPKNIKKMIYKKWYFVFLDDSRL